MNKKWKQQNGLYWTLVLSVIGFGGFYDWTAALLGAAVCVMGLFRIRKTNRCTLVRGPWLWLLLAQEVCLILSTVTAADRGMNLVGILRFLPILAWAFLCMQYTKEEREQALDAVPDLGCGMILVCLAAYLIPGLRDWLWSADRLGGFFQYSNTCALFFLLGIMWLGKKQRQAARFAKIQWSVLFWGILLTGSRTVMLLLLAVLVWQLFTADKADKFVILANLLAAIVAAVLMVLLTGSYQNLARLATVFTSNSTLYGRLLYWQDAFALILKHPLGLGWKGFYYIQPTIQTGVYTTMYVHNDLLQSFLDGGWISGLALGALMLLQLKKSMYREMLAVLFAHCLVDIDLQYASIWFVAILLFDFGEKTVSAKKEKRAEYQVYLGALALVCLYFCIPFGAEYLGRPDVAAYLYPGYTQAKEEVLAGTGDAQTATALADEILKANPYVSLAYDAKALSAYSVGDIQGFSENKEQVLAIERYDITQYQDYAYLLEQYAAYAAENGDADAVQFCMERRTVMEQMLQAVEKETSVLAWKLRDQPTFTLE